MTTETIRYLWWTGAVLMLFDALTTWRAITLGGTEANPIGVWLMDNIGLVSDCVLKVIVCTIVVWLMAILADGRLRWKRIGPRASNWIKRIAQWELVGTVILMTAIVANNLFMISLLV